MLRTHATHACYTRLLHTRTRATHACYTLVLHTHRPPCHSTTHDTSPTPLFFHPAHVAWLFTPLPPYPVALRPLPKVYVATDSSPVDMQSYELCADMIDAVIDVSSIYGLAEGSGAP